ncbi:uncharacterized protein [Physcomitrium patens]|uniref:Uncharacterized protein n=1 Tax=Physcomitrium patens TaxID=3218 RepID=A0A2K1KTT4_PHYPA|nr:uncharacterized protein LOC112280034 isoform X1 [Physcomitrium patens]PNR57192.1 hypothetical protein PHYPA_004185 [Physcomitrium patens]|eukprot:XP_024370725.1 uncharacterized protein LOC112280034 isoform X1 [Physcomitrella patens]
MTMGVKDLLHRSLPGAGPYSTRFADYQAKPPDVAASTRVPSLKNQGRTLPHIVGLSHSHTSSGALTLWRRDVRSWSSLQFNPLRDGITKQTLYGKPLRAKSLTVAAAASGSPNGSSEGEKAKPKTRAKQDVATLREKLNNFIDKYWGYLWLGGPIVATAAVFIPPATIPLILLLQKNFLVGLLATFGLDALFVFAADLFFVLADKAGHHQTNSGGSPPWIGPWEYTGYPKGEPVLTKVVAYAGVAIGVIGVILSFFLGKLAVGLPAFGSYLALIFIQVAYEKLLINDRVPAYPLVPIVYTMFRFKQLARAAELVMVMGGGAPLTFIIKALTIVWTFYLAMQLIQIPWLYSTWNSNKVA